MTDTVKYTFDQAFDGGARSRYDIEVAELRKEIEVARRESYEAGHQAGVAETKSALEAQATEVMSLILMNIAGFEQEIQRVAKVTEKECVELAGTLAQHLNLAAKADQMESEFQTLCTEALDRLSDHPILTLKVPEDVIEIMQQSAQQAAEKTGYDGNLKVEADPGLTAPDCRLVWEKGQIAFSDETVQSEINTLISGYLDRLSGDIEALEGSDAHV